MDKIVAKCIEEGEKKTTHMPKNYTSSLGGLAGRSIDLHSHLDQDPALILRHRLTSVGNVQRKSWAGDNSSILSCSKAFLGSFSTLNFFITPTSLLRDIHTSIRKESQPPLWQTTGRSLLFCKHSCPLCFSQRYPFLSSQAGKPGRLWCVCQAGQCPKPKVKPQCFETFSIRTLLPRGVPWY